MFYRLVFSLVALPLILLNPPSRRHASARTARSWRRCATCGAYLHGSSSYCSNHQRPVLLLPILERQQRRVCYHLNNCWTCYRSRQRQDDFIAFALHLEELAEEEWSTDAIAYVRDHIGWTCLPDFIDFLSGLEDSMETHLDVYGVVKLFVLSEERLQHAENEEEETLQD